MRGHGRGQEPDNGCGRGRDERGTTQNGPRAVAVAVVVAVVVVVVGVVAVRVGVVVRVAVAGAVAVVVAGAVVVRVVMKWLNTREVADYLGITLGALYQREHRRSLKLPPPDLVVGRTRLWRASTIRKWQS